jgi:hypothetical protein
MGRNSSIVVTVYNRHNFRKKRARDRSFNWLELLVVSYLVVTISKFHRI